MTPTERLQQALRASYRAGSDHDYICRCRPVDVRGTLTEIERLRAELQHLLDDATFAREHSDSSHYAQNWLDSCCHRIQRALAAEAKEGESDG